MRENAETIKYEKARIFDIPVMFTDYRIDRKSIPNGMFLYELRHTDENWGIPCHLAKGILVNFYGTVIANDPIQLPPDGLRDMKPNEFVLEPENDCKTLSDFCKKYPSQQKEIMEFAIAEVSEKELFFSKSEEQDKINGCIGHLRGDFGRGQDFYTTWFPHQNDVLNTEAFSSEINRVVNWLRQNYAPLKDYETMERFCRRREHTVKITEGVVPSYGFKVDTKQYRYMLRCMPVKGSYHFYMYCYDKQAAAKEKAEQPKAAGRQQGKKQEQEC